MIYITGDTHGEFGRFPGGDVLPGQRRLLQGDYVIVCGDFGLPAGAGFCRRCGVFKFDV